MPQAASFPDLEGLPQWYNTLASRYRLTNALVMDINDFGREGPNGDTFLTPDQFRRYLEEASPYNFDLPLSAMTRDENGHYQHPQLQRGGIIN